MFLIGSFSNSMCLRYIVIHHDANFYSRAPRLKHGMIVAFDDYYCWSSTNVSGERAALGEFLAAHPEWNFHRFKDVHWGAVAFVVEDASALARSSILPG